MPKDLAKKEVNIKIEGKKTETPKAEVQKDASKIEKKLETNPEKK